MIMMISSRLGRGDKTAAANLRTSLHGDVVDWRLARCDSRIGNVSKVGRTREDGRARRQLLMSSGNKGKVRVRVHVYIYGWLYLVGPTR